MTVDACPTNTGDSSGRTANSMPFSTRSSRVGSSEEEAQKSRIGPSVVTKSRNFAASSGLAVALVATSALPPKSPAERDLARGEGRAPLEVQGGVGVRDEEGAAEGHGGGLGVPGVGGVGGRLDRVVLRHEVLGEEAGGELDRLAARVGVDGRGDQVLGQEAAVGLEQPAQPAGDAVALPVVGERVLAARAGSCAGSRRACANSSQVHASSSVVGTLFTPAASKRVLVVEDHRGVGVVRYAVRLVAVLHRRPRLGGEPVGEVAGQVAAEVEQLVAAGVARRRCSRGRGTRRAGCRPAAGRRCW